MHLCNQHPDQDKEQQQHPRDHLCYFFHYSQQGQSLSHHMLVLPVFEDDINRIKQHAVSFMGLLSIHIMFVRYIHILHIVLVHSYGSM